MKINPLYFIFLLVFISCGGSKVAVAPAAEDMATTELISSYYGANTQFETLAARAQLSYDNGSKSQSATVNFRIKKDEIIWAKVSFLGITIAKVYITPKSVTYYETIGKTYFDGDFSLLSEWVGVPLDFNQVQNLLLGQSIFKLDAKHYTSEIVENTFKIQPKKQQPNFLHSLFLNPDNFKVALTSLSQPEYERQLTVRYSNYESNQGQFFPSDISIISIEEQDKMRVDINYRKIDLNVDIGFPFDVPSGYKQIKL